MIFANAFVCEFAAFAVKRKRMTGDAKVEQFLRHALNLMHAWIAEFKHFVAVGANKMVVLLVLIRLLELRLILTELMSRNQIAGEQQFNGIVKRSAAYTVLFILHVHVKRFNIEMPRMRIDFFKYSEAFRRFAVAVLLQIIGENLLYSVFSLLIWHSCLMQPQK
jgi:hypothetical protein